MRLIDADALRRDVLELPDCPNGYSDTFDKSMILALVDEAPTVDAVPVRYGKWIREVRYTIDSLHSYQQYRCSECDMTYITNTKYCPMCGTRMDEE